MTFILKYVYFKEVNFADTAKILIIMIKAALKF